MNINARQTRENSFGWLVKMLSNKIDKFMVEELMPLGLNMGTFAVLMMLSEKEGINQTELGKAVDVPGYTTTRTLDAMEENSLVERRPDPSNRRVHLIYLTKEGRELTKKIPPMVERVNSNFLYILKKNEITLLIDTLERVLHSTETLD